MNDLLNGEIFTMLLEARILFEAYRKEYNRVDRIVHLVIVPLLQNLAPEEFVINAPW